MKWIFALKEKIKMAFILIFIAGVIILFNVLMKSNVSGLEASMKSIYSDRLVAGATISTIIELNYQNHLQLEEHIHTTSAEKYSMLEAGIRRNNKEADSLLTAFKKTVLVAQEKEALDEFVQTNLMYRKFQNDMLGLSREGDKTSMYDQYLQKGNRLFQQWLIPAHQLSRIQISVGEDIYKASQLKIHGAQVISTVEAALVIVMLAGSYALMIASNTIINKPQKFWLN
ncbi:hypothetical protein GXP67_11595 [Rhodocytophaga rosea]|uniref:Chemotaxis methyl-accepting receptor HlyB-like 4HB MCP domain-containing protein n=1 Tax=Rhodocytophaga rosea TaxID=2704465 RepID=A0A6C0GGU8_9BACT|nr:MCP four helix bundle domain-containing protein [Rhodocytophaga rosea]QHT67236.1 hypothetical protein GXP67_11595 [Rhodocytophaga rosea]